MKLHWINFGIFTLLTFSSAWVSAQPVHRLDTVHLPDDVLVKRSLMKLEISQGEVFLRGSHCSGSSICRLSSPDSSAKQDIETKVDAQGNFICNLAFNPPPPSETNQPLSGANLRISDHLTSLDAYTEEQVYRSSISPDTSMDTDLFLDLGVGASRLDLSELKLVKLTVNSAFSDVLVNYRTPNRREMEQMEIHTASGNIVVKNLEMARARHVSVHNDMGETKLIIGSGYAAGSEIYIRSGVGGITLLVAPDQPVELRLKTGFFSSVDVDNHFQEIKDGTYINSALSQKPDERIIIHCEVEFGKLQIIQP